MIYNGGGERDLTELLPPPEQMKWISFPAAIGSHALVVGGDAHVDIVAFPAAIEDGRSTVAYSKCLHGSNTGPTLTQEEVTELPLFAPFNYNNKLDDGPQRPSSFSTVVIWYLLAIPDNGLIVHNDEFLPSFYEALRNIEIGQKIGAELAVPGSEEHTLQKGRSSPASQVHGYSKLAEDLSTHAGSMRSNVTTHPSPQTCVAQAGNQDLHTLLQYLGEGDEEELLGLIPGPCNVTFEEQTSFPEMLGKKLLVGWETPNRNAIYAYIRPTRGSHVVNYFAEGFPEENRQPIQATQLALHEIMYPFSKVYPENVHSIELRDRRRLTALVKWYFIAAGIIRDRILRETKDYPRLIKEALQYIRRRTQSEENVASNAISMDTFFEPSNERAMEQFTNEIRSPLPSLSGTLSQWSTADEDLPILAEGVGRPSLNITNQSMELVAEADDTSRSVEDILHDIEMRVSADKADEDADQRENAEIRRQVRHLEQRAQIIEGKIASRKRRLTKSRNSLRRGT